VSFSTLVSNNSLDTSVKNDNKMIFFLILISFQLFIFGESK